MTQITALTDSHRNPGIVPPWLANSTSKNPGIVPPWLANPIHILPINDSDDPIFSILPIDDKTAFVPEPVDLSPRSLADAIRGR